VDCRGHLSALCGIAVTLGTLIFTATGKILEVRAPFLLGIIDVIAVPSLTLFFGTRLLHFGACAAAKACHKESKNADYFPGGGHVFHIFLVPQRCHNVVTHAFHSKVCNGSSCSLWQKL
jgi:hypothetical protein